MASGSGWNLWVWLAGGGCGCKEVYRFPHTVQGIIFEGIKFRDFNQKSISRIYYSRIEC